MAIWREARDDISTIPPENAELLDKTYLVSLSDFTNNVLLGNLDVVKAQKTSGRRLDTEL